MKFTYKSEAELQAMDEAQRDAYAQEKREFEAQVIKEEIAKAVKESKEALEKDLEKSNKRVEEVADEIASLKEGNTTEETPKSLKDQIKEALLGAENFEALKTNKNASLNFVVKAPADMLISTNTTGRVARIDVDSERARVVRRKPFIMDGVTVRSTNGNTLYYVEQKNPDGAPAMTAEGAVKAQIDWDYVEASTPVRKITAFTKVSKEMLDDVDGLAQDIADEITERILLVADAQVLTGDGTGINLVGISVNATPFTAGALADAVTGANELDCLRAGIAQVVRQEFYPTKIYVHPDKLALMDLKKGSDNHYLMPPFTSADGTVIKGIQVEANTGVGADDFYVGDFSKYIVKVREDISIQLGYDGNDWTKNMITPLGETRLGGYIKSNHYGAIVKGVFTSAKALLDPAV